MTAEEVILAILHPFVVYYNQLFIAGMLFVIGQKFRKYGIVTFCVLSLAYLLTFNLVGNITIGWFDARTLLVYASLFVILFASLKINVFHALFMSTVSYTMQQFCFYIARLCGVGNYPHTIGWDLLYVGIVAVGYSLFYFFVIRRLKNVDFEIRRKQIFLGICVCALIIASVISSATRVYDHGSVTVLWYGLMCSVLLLSLEVGFIGFNAVERDKILMERIDELQLKQSEHLQVNIDTINRKVHDLKHILSAAKTMTEEEQKASLKELRDSIEMYDSTVNTGNDTLDAVLTEKMFYCKSHGIRLTALIDGNDFSFMDKADIYSLLGNALDNAIDYLCNLEPAERRVVTVTSDKWLGYLKLTIENYVEGDIDIVDGLPVSKKSGDYHGYGTHSMKYIAEKYKGEFSISCEDNKFTVSIVFDTDKAKRKS